MPYFGVVFSEATRFRFKNYDRAKYVALIRGIAEPLIGQSVPPAFVAAEQIAGRDLRGSGCWWCRNRRACRKTPARRWRHTWPAAGNFFSPAAHCSTTVKANRAATSHSPTFWASATPAGAAGKVQFVLPKPGSGPERRRPKTIDLGAINVAPRRRHRAARSGPIQQRPRRRGSPTGRREADPAPPERLWKRPGRVFATSRDTGLIRQVVEALLGGGAR